MSLFTFMLSLEIEALQDFLENNLQDIDSEIAMIESNWDESEAEHEDEFGNLMYKPMQREEITLRAIYYELNALIESHLCSFAQKAYLKSTKYVSKPKSILSVSKNDIKKVRLVSDLSIGEIRNLIEKYYNFSFEEVPEYKTFMNIREIANSFKHRGGYEDFRKTLNNSFPTRYILKRKEVQISIKNTKRFLSAIYKKVNLSKVK